MDQMGPAAHTGYWLEIFGCQMNVNDSEIIRGILDGAGYVEAAECRSADVILIMTCAVRERAETRAFGRVTHLAGLRREGRKPTIVLCGCMAQEHGGSLLETIPGIDHVIGPDGYRLLPDLLAGGRGGTALGLGHEDYEGIHAVRKSFPRAFVSIMRGCDNFCTYCIVPHVRGREHSRRADGVTAEVARLSMAGFREITLLGQNVNSYGNDGMDFPGLLARAADEAFPAWIRFVTSHPRDFSESLAETISSRANICRQIHLPVQSGSDRVLGLMNRRYTRGEYLEKISMLRNRLPGVVLSTDVIAGFPGETEEDFSESLSLLEEVRFDYAFLFKYSERSGTAAAGFEGALPVPERLRRLQALQKLQNEITLSRSAALVGRLLPVLITGGAEKQGQQAGRTAGNRVAVLDGTSFEPGSFVLARIASADGWTHHSDPVRLLISDERFEAVETWAGS
jgi:tRNA-2-methylthio-N6-dimethylallyladenosine synthase